MPRSRYPQALPLLRTSWSFLAKNPVLFPTALVLSVRPTTMMDLLTHLQDAENPLGQSSVAEMLRMMDPIGVSLGLLLFFFLIIAVWGQASILLVGRRMIQSKAGRPRTSVRAVAGDALPFVMPLILTSIMQLAGVFYRSLLFILPITFAFLFLPCPTSILEQISTESSFFAKVDLLVRGCPGLLLLLPLLIPSIVYALRTYFFSIAIVSDDGMYREALRKSKKVTRGRLWLVLRILLGTIILTMGPVFLIEVALFTLLLAAPSLEAFELLFQFITNTLYALAGILFTLASIGLYGKLRDMPEQVKG